jgi:glycine/D-amino acid oxidase-like deaminating enzyme
MLTPLDQTLWSAISPASPSVPSLSEETQTDIVIIGGGFLGLSTALYLAEASISTVVLEAEEFGYGASGRNTGFVVPSLKMTMGIEDLAERLGPNFGERLLALVGESANTVFELIRRHAIDCNPEQNGWIQAAHAHEIVPILKRRGAEWRARGHDVELLTDEATARAIGSTAFKAALFFASGGQLNPLAYARGLARACLQNGARLFQQSPALAIEAQGENWLLRTPHGSVRASRVLLTTNALVGRLMPEMADSIIPVRVHQIATEPLGEAVRRDILSGRVCAADTRRHPFVARWSPDNRLLTGGLVMQGPASLARARAKFTKRLATFFPDHAPFSASFVWNGIIAVLPDSLPRLIRLRPGIEAAIGCNGRGIALTTALGGALAGRYAGRLTDNELPLPFIRPKKIPFRYLTGIVPSLWLPWSEAIDWLAARRSR